MGQTVLVRRIACFLYAKSPDSINPLKSCLIFIPSVFQAATLCRSLNVHIPLTLLIFSKLYLDRRTSSSSCPHSLKLTMGRWNHCVNGRKGRISLMEVPTENTSVKGCCRQKSEEVRRNRKLSYWCFSVDCPGNRQLCHIYVSEKSQSAVWLIIRTQGPRWIESKVHRVQHAFFSDASGNPYMQISLSHCCFPATGIQQHIQRLTKLWLMSHIAALLHIMCSSPSQLI